MMPCGKMSDKLMLGCKVTPFVVNREPENSKKQSSFAQTFLHNFCAPQSTVFLFVCFSEQEQIASFNARYLHIVSLGKQYSA